MYAKKIAPPKARWVKARTRVHLVIDGKGTNIDGPIYRPGHDLPHVQEIQDFIETACNSHAGLMEMADLFCRSIEYQIKRDLKDGDKEGAALKRVTLEQCKQVLAKGKVRHD